ncbi:MAG: DNA polymerase III subunit delta' [Sedimentisphaerales bacterium]|nr:DNA polymerase III subunit delta' [Sedimentisphaerales bacterium]
MSLKEVLCQERGISLLRRAFAAGRVPHAYIFAGGEGIGKFKTASEWGKVLLCREPIFGDGDSVDSCGRCDSCRLVDSDAHPDFSIVYKELIEFTREGKNKKAPLDLPIDVIREFVVEKVSTRPSLSERKVYIIREAEKLNISSQNCLLKALEEPPEYCCIILLCTRLESLLATTRSRCQIIRFGPVGEDLIFEKLHNSGIGADAGRYFARLSGGSMGLACRWGALESSGAGLYKIKKEVVESIVKLEYGEIPDAAADLLEKSKAISKAWVEAEGATSAKDISRQAAKSVVRMAISALYDAMNLHLQRETTTVNSDQSDMIQELAGRFSAEQLAEMVSDCYEILRWIESNVNERLIFEQLLFNLAGSDRISA